MSIGSVISAAAPVVGGLVSGFGASSRRQEAAQQASRPLVLNQNTPFGSSTFDPRTQAFSLTPSQQLADLGLLGRRAIDLGFTSPDPISFGDVPTGFAIPGIDFDNLARPFNELENISDSFGGIIKQAGQVAVDLGKQISGVVDRARSTGATTSDEIRALLPDVRPGFGRISEDIKEQFDLAEGVAAGDVKESFRRRAILGSSFATREAAAVKRDFTQAKSQALNQAFIQELDLTASLLKEAFSVDITALQEQFRGLGLQADVELGALAEQSRAATGQLGAQEAFIRGKFGQAEINQRAAVAEAGLELDARGLRTDRELARFGQELDLGRLQLERDVRETGFELTQDQNLFSRFAEFGTLAARLTSDLQASFQSTLNSLLSQVGQAERGIGAAVGRGLGVLGGAVGDTRFGDIFGETGILDDFGAGARVPFPAGEFQAPTGAEFI